MRLRAFVVLAASMMLPAEAECQSLWVGLRGGIVRARQVDDYGPSASLGGAAVGLATVLEVRPWLGLEADFFFTEKGWRHPGSGGSSLDYLEIPMLVRLAIPGTDVDADPDLGVRPFVLVGAVRSFLVGCSTIIAKDGYGTTDGHRRPTRFDDHQFGSCSSYDPGHRDAGAQVGAGVSLRRLQYQVTLEARHTRGLTDIRSGPLPQTCGPCTLTNRVSSVLAGVVMRM
jgi:hypothetical protein